jgi:hypothetical protein
MSIRICPESVIVHQVNIAGIPRLKSEDNAPIGGDINGVVTSQSPLQCMQAVPGPAEMLDASRGVEVGQYQSDPFDVLRRNAASIVRFEEAPQPAVPEASNHGDSKSDK